MVPSTAIRTTILSIAYNANIVATAVGSTVATSACDDSLLHGAVGGEVLEEPGLEAAGLEVAVGYERIGRRPVGDVVDSKVSVGVGGVALRDAWIVEVGSQPTIANGGVGGVEEPAEGAAASIFGTLVFASLDALLPVGVGVEELDEALVCAYESQRARIKTLKTIRSDWSKRGKTETKRRQGRVEGFELQHPRLSMLRNGVTCSVVQARLRVGRSVESRTRWVCIGLWWPLPLSWSSLHPWYQGLALRRCRRRHLRIAELALAPRRLSSVEPRR